jgi:hypothetical protein
LVVTFAGVAGADDVAGAGADVAGDALAAEPDAVSVAGELGAGLAGAAVVVAGAPADFAPHAAAEHDDCPLGAADAAGVTSFACTGAGVPPPHATAALVPRTARTAAIFSRLRSGRIGFLLDSV